MDFFLCMNSDGIGQYMWPRFLSAVIKIDYRCLDWCSLPLICSWLGLRSRAEGSVLGSAMVGKVGKVLQEALFFMWVSSLRKDYDTLGTSSWPSWLPSQESSGRGTESSPFPGGSCSVGGGSQGAGSTVHRRGIPLGPLQQLVLGW